MTSANLGAVGRRATLATAIVLSLCSVPAHAVVIDGNLSDLINAVNTAPYNAASGTDPLGSADSPATESNNGFDISNVYAFYDWPADVLYLGLSVYGTVGDSQPAGSIATNEGLANAGAGSNSRSIFDANETYGLRLYGGTTTSDPLLLAFNVLGANNGTDSLTGVTNNYSLGITRAVSETNDGVEFSISGLFAQGALPYFSFTNPADLLIRFSAGSSDTNAVSALAEDSHLLQMQVVPVPAAAWLFGSGLAGLYAVARNRRKTA